MRMTARGVSILMFATGNWGNLSLAGISDIPGLLIVAQSKTHESFPPQGYCSLQLPWCGDLGMLLE
ncbi:MAG: hypothetical protein M3O26_06035 [Pseudomonadota bacterium]|nr:hypothetical protein [Pseudomonadota bacterium]